MLNSLGVITDIKKIDTFHKPSYLEIGSGKGQFISSLAEKIPIESLYCLRSEH